jgi:putative transferase (TIGR04331 family)
VVLVEALTPPDTYLLRFSSVPLANQTYREIERLAEFAARVTSAKQALVLKRFPSDREWARPSELERLPVPRALAGRPAVEWMRSARVAVVAYPDTPFIQAMVLGAPTLGLWDTELWEMRPDAAVHFERLAQLGVIYRDPLAAAAKLDEIYERADEWWASGEIQAARTAFLERFAVRGDWLPAWTRVLRELARG